MGHVYGLLLNGHGVIEFGRDEGHRETSRALGNGQEIAYGGAGQLERIAEPRRSTLTYMCQFVL
ncbi:hypothetical protein WI80_04135 [Burkholderia ubonensis]|nr:hypothetical protein WI80_04135 [Burkholderia ubonensis]KVD45424.1 hypothetical protein WI84_31395 [Burkholderia ubonensis]KVU14019.1 hypothetical protein WK62_31230 [Burkholderia ubonensis]KVU23797.1 hypothetical protein WK63_28425 [Burkholderia ubonensis]